MKLARFYYLPHSEVEFTREDLHVLMALSQQHYDARCKALSQLGGALWGLQNAFIRGLPTASRRLNYDEIDLLAKTCEPSSCEGNDFVVAKGSELWMGFRQLLTQMNDEYARLNNPNAPGC